MKNWKLWPRNFVVFRWLPVQMFLFLIVQHKLVLLQDPNAYEWKEGLDNNMVLYVGFFTSSLITQLGSMLSNTTKARNATALLNHKPREIWNITKTSSLGSTEIPEVKMQRVSPLASFPGPFSGSSGAWERGYYTSMLARTRICHNITEFY